MIVREAELKWRARRQVGAKLTNAGQVAAATREALGADPREHVLVFWRDSRGESLVLHRVAVGTQDSAPVHPREVFRAAILAGARSVIFAHNHPSGDATPSREDRVTHERLREAGELLGIELLDSVIVTDVGHASEREGHWR